MPLIFTRLIQEITQKYHDPGLDYLTLLTSIPYDPLLLKTKQGRTAYQTKLFQTTRTILHWKYSFGSLRTKRMIEGIQRILETHNFYTKIPNQLPILATELTPFLITRPIDLSPLINLPPLQETTPNNAIPTWHYYNFPNTPPPTNHFYQELTTSTPLPAHDWRISLPNIPQNPTLIPQYILTNHYFITFTLDSSQPTRIQSLYLFSVSTPHNPLHVE